MQPEPTKIKLSKEDVEKIRQSNPTTFSIPLNAIPGPGPTKEEIIAAGHPPMATKVILCDFDGTIQPFGDMFEFPAPLPGAKDTLNELRGKGYKIGIFTSRLSKRWLATENQNGKKHRAYIKLYCKMYGIPCDFITAEKVPCEYYIDDRAVPFGGHWDITRGFLGLKMEGEK